MTDKSQTSKIDTPKEIRFNNVDVNETLHITERMKLHKNKTGTERLRLG